MVVYITLAILARWVLELEWLALVLMGLAPVGLRVALVEALVGAALEEDAGEEQREGLVALGEEAEAVEEAAALVVVVVVDVEEAVPEFSSFDD